MGVPGEQCSCLHLQALIVMAPCGKIILLFLLVEVALAARRLRNNQQRDQRSLTNTFPFNQKEASDKHHGDHHGNHAAPVASVASFDSRDSRQGDDVVSKKERRSAMTRLRPWCRTPPRNSVLWSPREPVSTSPSWCPSWSPPRSVWMYPRRCAPGPGPTPGRSRNLWSRSGATFLLKNLASHKCLSLIQLEKLILTLLTMRMKT